MGSELYKWSVLVWLGTVRYGMETNDARARLNCLISSLVCKVGQIGLVHRHCSPGRLAQLVRVLASNVMVTVSIPTDFGSPQIFIVDLEWERNAVLIIVCHK